MGQCESMKLWRTRDKGRCACICRLVTPGIPPGGHMQDQGEHLESFPMRY